MWVLSSASDVNPLMPPQYIHRNVPTSILNPVEVWHGYPHVLLAGPVKLYYLIETAFYIHQVLVLNAEARRKDHWQMMTHHFITVFLMTASFYYNLSRVGSLIMVIMDWCDIWLPVRHTMSIPSVNPLTILG